MFAAATFADCRGGDVREDDLVRAGVCGEFIFHQRAMTTITDAGVSNECARRCGFPTPRACF